MPSPKSWKAYSPVKPIYPRAPYEADKADYGQMCKVKADEYKKGSGKYGSPAKNPYKPPGTYEEKEEMTSWIEIELVDEYDKPVPGEPFEVTLPDGTVYSGTLDPKGFYRIDGIYPGTCQITFPNLDKDAWEKLGGGGGYGKGGGQAGYGKGGGGGGYGKGGGQGDYGKGGGQGGGYSKGGDGEYENDGGEDGGDYGEGGSGQKHEYQDSHHYVKDDESDSGYGKGGGQEGYGKGGGQGGGDYSKGSGGHGEGEGSGYSGGGGASGGGGSSDDY